VEVMNILSRLEQYTLNQRQEVLLLTAEVNGEPDQIVIFRGFSSSMVRSTSADPDTPVLGDRATIITIDRLRAPYDPVAPQYLQQGLTWDSIQPLLNGKSA